MRTKLLLGLLFLAGASALAAEPGSGAKTRAVVMSFNVLCSFCDRTNYDPWDERLAYMKDIFERHKPDLIGLQEISKEEEVGQIAALVPGYKAIFYKDPPGPKAKAYPDATILYREARYEEIESGTIWLGKEPDKAWSRGWAKAAFWRLAVWARLKEKATGRELYFLSTHFDNNQPNQPNSAPLILDRVAPWAEKMPCIVIGDFNSKPDSPAYATLTQGAEGKGFKFANAYDLAKAPETDPKDAPPEKFDPASRIDHIFLAGKADFAVARWIVDLHVYGASARYPSDHRAIAAEVEY